MPHGSKNVKETIALFDLYFQAVQERTKLLEMELFITRTTCECGHCHARKKAGLKCTNPNCILNRSLKD